MSPLALPQLRSLPSISCVPYSGVKQEDVGVTAAAGRITQARPISRHGEGERGEEQRKKYQRTGGSYPTGSWKRPVYSGKVSAAGFPIWSDIVAPWIEGVIYCTWADLPSLPPSNRSLSRQTALPPSPSWTNRQQFNRFSRSVGALDWRYLVQLCKCQSAALPSKTGRTARARPRTPPEGERTEDV